MANTDNTSTINIYDEIESKFYPEAQLQGSASDILHDAGYWEDEEWDMLTASDKEWYGNE